MTHIIKKKKICPLFLPHCLVLFTMFSLNHWEIHENVFLCILWSILDRLNISLSDFTIALELVIANVSAKISFFNPQK